MKLFDKIKELTSKTNTENGDIAYTTTLDYCVDLFGVINASRNNLKGILDLFVKAYNQDPKLALKVLMYSRDVRGGAGERDTFRVIFNYLANHESKIARQLLPYIIEIGRYDDLLVALTTPIEEDVIALIKKQLALDLKSLKENGTVSLLAKWMPSVNASNKDTVMKGKYLAKKLNMSEVSYRKMLSSLRKGRIIENNLREKDYTFKYENVPSLAMHKYNNAFIRNDKERYSNYLEDVKNGKTKINVSTLYLYDIIREYKNKMSKASIDAMEAKWNNYPRNYNLGNTIVVRDGSGSMYGTPLEIATSLAIYFSELLEGEFKNKFITFSSKPELVELPGTSLKDNLDAIYKYNDYTNTDISKVYDVILDVYRDNKETIIDRILIISDMEFDQGVACESTYKSFKKEFDKLGVKMPEVVYWNANARNIHFATNDNQPNIRFVSGASSKVIDSILNGENLTQKEFVVSAVSKYSFIDELDI